MMPKHNHIKVIFSRIKIAPKFLDQRITGGNDSTINEEKFFEGKKSFQYAMKFPIVLGQFLCLIPISQNHFSWFSFRIFISILVMCCQAIMAILSLFWLNRSGISIFKSGTVLFFGGAALMMLLMIRLSFKWSKLISKWSHIEEHFGYAENLKRVFRIISTLIIIFSTVEHLSNLLFGLASTYQNSTKILKAYSLKMFPQVFEVVPYTMWRAIPVLYINSVSTLIYSFGDQLIIMISWALGNCFETLNKQIFSLRGKHVPQLDWQIFRLKYIKLGELTCVVDDCLSHLLCLTFLIHLYIICIEIHQGMLHTSDGSEKVHAILSFAVSILRACALCYTTVRIHERSKKILDVLYEVPTASYCPEVELFMQQILQNEIVLTGSHIFSMKRKLLLTIGGTIASYQILLLQMRDFSNAEEGGIET